MLIAPDPVHHIKGKLLTLITTASQVRNLCLTCSCDPHFSLWLTQPLLTHSWPLTTTNLRLSQPHCTPPPCMTFALMALRVHLFLFLLYFILFLHYLLFFLLFLSSSSSTRPPSSPFSSSSKHRYTPVYWQMVYWYWIGMYQSVQITKMGPVSETMILGKTYVALV